MRCTDRSKRYMKARKRRDRWVRCLSVILIALCIAAGYIYYQKEIIKPEYLAMEYEAAKYETTLYQGELYARDLCVAAEDVSLEGAPDTSGVKAAALFDVDSAETDFAYHIHDRLYPASTTKILTALVAIKNGDLSDTVTVSKAADCANFASDEQICGIKAGDQMSLGDLLYGLILYSGNDNAVAIAEHIAGSEEAFAQMMNEQAGALMATNSHFVNSNGLHDPDHYTTAYDLYLIFNECIKHEEFVNILQTSSHTVHITGADGSVRDVTWEPTNYYALGQAEPPTNVTIIGGKTGTTKNAGNCLILLNKDQNQQSHISVVMGAASKGILYQNMTAMIQAMPDN